jgi:DNA-binding transcriptional MerR regulator
VTNGLSIGQVARRAGLRASAIRYYEASGLLPEPARVGGWRRYGEGVLRRLAAIDVAKRAGFTLEEIHALFHGFPERARPAARWAAAARKKLPEIERRIAEAEAARAALLEGMRCRCATLDACPIVARAAAAPNRRPRGARRSAFPLVAALVAAALAGGPAACTKKETADVARARPVMEAFIAAERDHRGSHGNFWRDRQPTVGRDAAMTALGVDIAEAPGFEFTIDPPDGGYDPVLRITARGKGEASKVSIACVQDAKSPKPDCKETP